MNSLKVSCFGHEKGAFTGAIERKIGKFQYAEGGTLFLDEIGDISPQMQVKLLRVLQEKVFSPVGSNRVLNSNVRIIAASHRPFEEMIKDGSFRRGFVLSFKRTACVFTLPLGIEKQISLCL